LVESGASLRERYRELGTSDESVEQRDAVCILDHGKLLVATGADCAEGATVVADDDVLATLGNNVRNLDSEVAARRC